MCRLERGTSKGSGKRYDIGGFLKIIITPNGNITDITVQRKTCHNGICEKEYDLKMDIVTYQYSNRWNEVHLIFHFMYMYFF